MKKSLSYVVALLFVGIAVSFAGPDKAAIEAKEKVAWQSFKDKKEGDFKKVVSKDIKCVYAEGVSDMAKELADMQKWDVKSFTFSDFNAVPAGADTMVTTYTVTIDGTYDGKDMSGTYNCGSVWKMEKGGWMGIFHTMLKPEAAAK
jgi:hypothetical protein